ncbi:Phenol hydroxylase P4 protein [Methylocella tundrae]|uniref:Phenol hydroxylase P4 protein n=1 Tax=Methylocella tundrae TaxID=227605 RepID=A0A8B6M6Z7_METTU|nr:phenol hydroxylase subunit P4 [Methylocella tundrae]VTZ28376.1 Phenol hydroxylase P4 protein [Methylocella tundrae]VTZ50809.1 Phenol hydroxylase P4 protein [Methylocella tundrae]
MTTVAIGPYAFPPRDRVENFHGLQLVHFLWERHLMFASPITAPLSAATPFSAVIGEVLPMLYSKHPDFAAINWNAVEWDCDGVPFTPDLALTLADLGVGHKSLLRFRTPGLEGLAKANF